MGENTWTGARRQLRREMDDLCESPAESGLLWAMLMHGGPEQYTFGPSCAWELRPQLTIRTAGRTYRVDFAVKRGDVRVAIEVDGHAYHHATEEQKAYDEARDWILGQMQWHVIRVPAWRALDNPSLCLAEDVLPLLEQVYQGAIQPRQAPDEDMTDEEFESSLYALKTAAARERAAGHVEAAAENEARIELRRLRRQEKFQIGQMDSMTAAEQDALLREIYRRRGAA